MKFLLDEHSLGEYISIFIYVYLQHLGTYFIYNSYSELPRTILSKIKELLSEYFSTDRTQRNVFTKFMELSPKRRLAQVCMEFDSTQFLGYFVLNILVSCCLTNKK